MHRQIAGKLTGPVTKWIVVGVWIVLFVGASGIAQKRTEVFTQPEVPLFNEGEYFFDAVVKHPVTVV